MFVERFKYVVDFSSYLGYTKYDVMHNILKIEMVYSLIFYFVKSVFMYF